MIGELERAGSEPSAMSLRSAPEAASPAKRSKVLGSLGQTVLVLQGGGALGAYQVGVYQALHEAGIEPDWVIGTSIGAINAALIAGSEPGRPARPAERLLARVRARSFRRRPAPADWLGAAIAQHDRRSCGGRPGFFTPNPHGVREPARSRWAPDAAGYYQHRAAAARRSSELVDFDQLNQRHDPRSRSAPSTSAPARCATSTAATCRSTFATSWPRARCRRPSRPVRIDGELYWDGGILSNTPVEVVFDDNPRRDSPGLRGPHLEPARAASRRRSGR